MRNRWAAALIALVLTGCGGEGSTSSPAPVATATPAPSPAPSPTPTPTPAPTPTQAFDFTGSLFGQSPFAEVVYYERYDATSPRFWVFDKAAASLDTNPAAAIVTWDAPTKTATARVNDVLTVYEAASLSVQRADAIRFIKNVDADTQHVFQWTRAADWNSLSAAMQEYGTKVASGADAGKAVRFVRYMLPGLPTPTGELPVSGTIRYAGSIVGTIRTANPDLIAANAVVTLDLAANTVTGSVTTNGRTYQINGTFDRTQNNRIAGTFAMDSQSGRIVGNLYGPQAREIGILFAVDGAASSVAGSIQGVRQ